MVEKRVELDCLIVFTSQMVALRIAPAHKNGGGLVISTSSKVFFLGYPPLAVVTNPFAAGAL